MKEFYINNRKKLVNLLDDNTITILFADAPVLKTADEEYPFNSNRNFYYLTGIDEPNDILVLIKKNNTYQEVLFINEFDEFNAKWIGRHYFETEASEISGIKSIYYIKDFLDYFTKNQPGLTVYIDKKTFYYTKAQEFITMLTEKNISFQDVFPYLTLLRMKKEDYEVDQMKNAISITNLGLKAILNNLKPGLYEYQLESFFDQQIKYNGSKKHAFTTIAASGKNSCVLHYHDNNQQLQDNELVLLDLGAEYNHYKADISRTYPINGKFTPRQKEIYNIVLNGQKEVFKNIRPGITTKELNDILIAFYARELKRINLINNDEEVKKYYYHGVSHHIGLDTHDVSILRPLEESNIISVEPGLYIAEENIGIRIEDDALVTLDGCINLSSEIIKEVEDIENYLNNKKS